jgi:hypothetical protein
LAATLYPHTRSERETILPFFVEQLRACGQCTAAENHIVEWVRSGLEFGRQIKAHEPLRVSKIFGEIGESEVETVRRLVTSVVARAGGMKPAALAGAILIWHKKTHERNEPSSYARRLERIVHCVDFAVWTAWVA